MSNLDEAAKAARRDVIIQAIVHGVNVQLHAGILDAVERSVDERGLVLNVKGDILLAPLAEAILQEISPFA